MALAALIAAYHEAEGTAGGLRATLPLAGQTVLERQARLASAAGANPILVLVERLGPELLAAIDRLRSAGLTVIPARSAADAAAALDAGDRLLLVADGFVGEEAHPAALLAAGTPSLLTMPDASADERFERIDGRARWGGLALVEGALLKQTADMLGDWDLQSTLLRRAVQAGARQVAMPGEPATIVQQPSDLAELQQRIFDGMAAASGREWVSRYLLAPLERAATRVLMPTRLSPAALGSAAAAATGIGAIAFGFGYLWPGLLLLLLAAPLEGIAGRLSRLRMQGGSGLGWWCHLLPASAAAALLALGYALSENGAGWGCIAVAAVAIAFLVALAVERQGHVVRGELFLAERRGMAWLMLPFAALDLWVVGIAALALYAGASFFWAQQQVHRHVAPRQD